MSAGRWVLLILLLAAAFGVGHVVGSSGLPHATPELAATESAPPTPSDSRSSPLRGSQGPTLSAGPAGDAETAPFERALAELPPLEIPRGDGRIDVTVKTEDGTGVQGVRVTCVPEMPKDLVQPRREGWQDDVDAARVLLDAANRLRWRTGALLETVTDASGACSFEGLTQVKHAVAAQSDGWQIRSTFRNVHQAEPGSTVEFTAKPRTRIRVEVVMPDGTAPERAQIRFQRGNSSSGRSWTPERPDVDTDVGTWEVTASAGDDERYRSQTERVTVEEGRPSPVVRLDLVERTMLKTTVVPAEDEGTTDVALRLVRVPAGATADLALLSAVNESRHPRVNEGRSMVFTDYDLEVGTWLVGAYRGWQGPLVASRVVQVEAGLNEITLQLPTTARKDYALLRVRGPDGKPLIGLSFMASFEDDAGSMSSSGASVAVRSAGEYWVFHHPEGTRGRKGTCRITVEHPQLGKQVLSYAAGEAPTFDVRFEEPATVEVTLVGLTGDRYAGRLTVQLSPDGSSMFPHMMGPTSVALDANGRAELSGIQPGAFLVSLQLTSERWGGLAIAEEKITVRAGTQGVRLKVRALYVVEIEGVTTHAHINRTDTETGRRSFVMVQPGAEGRAIVDGLIAGEYQLQMGSKVTTFRLPGTSKVRIE